MQIDQLNLMVVLAEKNCKIMHYSRRYLYIFDHFSSFIMQISLPTKHYFTIFFSKNDHKIKLVVLHTINPLNSTKWVTTFSGIFHFSLKEFSKKISFSNARCLWGMLNYVQGQKRRQAGAELGQAQLKLGLGSISIKDIKVEIVFTPSNQILGSLTEFSQMELNFKKPAADMAINSIYASRNFPIYIFIILITCFLNQLSILYGMVWYGYSL